MTVDRVSYDSNFSALIERRYREADSTFPRRGRRTSSPPQFGQTAAIASAHFAQKVHS